MAHRGTLAGAGLLLLLALTGAQLAIGVVTDTLERRRTERGLRALGAPERVLRTAILAEHGLLLAVAAFTAGTVGAVMIWAAPRWLNKTPIPSGWVATTYLTLFGVLVFAAAAALATALPRDHEHRADDTPAEEHAPLLASLHRRFPCRAGSS